MKICKLKLKNLNSFRGEQEIDFEGGLLNDASLVAITGPTGAGKTTLLDAICVALYGKTPRLSGTTNQHPRHLISHGETEGFAEVHFEANSTRYHATWSLKRNGSPKGQLFDDSGKLITTKVAQEVESILGLDFNAFKRSVMLAQGEFAAFLKASDEDRRKILEATAGIGIYDELKKALNDKVSEVEAANADVLDKLNKIPEASQEQLTEAETELDSLQAEADALGTQSQHIHNKKRHEEEREKDFERLQSSEKRQNELMGRQLEIDVIQETLENANRAQRLLPEKQAYNTAKSDFEGAEKALCVATAEKIDAEERVEANQTIFDEKEDAYQEASGERDRKVKLYTAAKLDVERAADQFVEADRRTSELTELDNQIDTLSSQLDDKQTEQSQLHERIQTAQIFLDENPLPLDRQQRLTGATGLLAQLGLQEKHLETESTSRTQHEETVVSLKREIGKLSEAHEKRLAEKTEAETTLKAATAELSKLHTDGTREEWDARKRRAVEVYPIAQGYETVISDLADAESDLHELNEANVELDAKLEQIGVEMASQVEAYQRATVAVQRCEEALRSALLADSANQLRQHLHEGEPCPVCGATEHPSSDVMESESEDLLQDAERDLEHARTEAHAAEAHRQALQTTQAQTEQDKRNITSQIDDCTDKVETLRNQVSQFLAEWQEIYPDTDVSSDWIADQVVEAETAIADIGEAEQARTEASHSYEMVLQQLETCENDIARETESLKESERQLQNVSNDVTDLQADIASTENSFWESLPGVFHGVAPKEAVERFSNKIEEVATYQEASNNAESELKLLNTKIETDQNRLETLRKDRKEVRAEIDSYRHEGETYLNAVRDRTAGLETEAEMNAAIDALETELQTKKNERDKAEQQLLESRNLLAEKQATYRIRENRNTECGEKLETAREAYVDKLSEAGFDSSDTHDNAFRDETQIQQLTEQIDDHEDEKQALELVITELRARFQENPFDPTALGRIEAQVEEIGEQLQAAQQEVGAQQQKINDLKDALAKREALGVEISEAEQELKRWKRLQDTIPRNDLRDFALEIMFKQMGELANEQLKYLTSERYQLKVEGIGNLTVIDRWNANEERPVETLSGGESFLTSLALALALADLSRGRAQLNSLFLDEGFGTLDTETLDVAIAALEGLRMQGRSIFLISHIQELTRRLPVKINVRKQGNGSSSVDIRG